MITTALRVCLPRLISKAVRQWLSSDLNSFLELFIQLTIESFQSELSHGTLIRA